MIHRRNKNLRVVREPENPADPTDKIIEQIMDELNSEDGSMNDMEEQIKKHKIKFWRRIILSTAAVLAVAAGIYLLVNLQTYSKARTLDTYASGGSANNSSVAFDLGILYKREIKDWEGAGWSVGIHASNLGPKIKYLTSKEALPAMVKVGGAADLPFASMHRLTLTADLGYRLSPDDVQALNVSAGAEYAWMEHLMLRGGYHYGDKNKGDASYATAGAGVEYAGVHLDFAWMFAGHECLARNTFWISLGYSF